MADINKNTDDTVSQVYCINGHSPMSKEFLPSKYTTDLNIYEQSNDYEITVVDRLRAGLDYALSLGVSNYYRRIIECGYVLPIHNVLHSSELKNNKSSRQDPLFVQSEIDKLLQSGAIVELDRKPHIINPLTVAEKWGKKRLVIDLRVVNEAITVPKHKYEGADTLRNMLSQNGFMTQFDLKSGYHHVPLSPTQYEYFGFSFEDFKGQVRFFHFVVLPFGLNIAGLIFTKLLRQFIKIWRNNLIKVVLYLDDGINSHLVKEKCLRNAQYIYHSLVNTGWVPHKDKSFWIPKQITQWLGFEYNLIKGMVTATDIKINRLLTMLAIIKINTKYTIRFISKLVGTIISLELSHGDMVFLKTRWCQIHIAIHPILDRKYPLSDDMMGEIYFWRQYLIRGNGIALFIEPTAATIIYSDASAVAAAAFFEIPGIANKVITNYSFSPEQCGYSSTHREMLAISKGLADTCKLLANKALHWFTDSQNVARIVRRGSMKSDLQELAVNIFEITRDNNIVLSVSWTRRTNNKEADSLSRIVDFDDWGVSKVWYEKIIHLLGISPDIDRFASVTNTHLLRFNSRFYSDSAEATDAFTQLWTGNVNWVVPPLFLIPRVIALIMQQKADAILVCPFWTSAQYWPHVLELLHDSSNCVKQYLRLPNIFVTGTVKKSLIGSEEWTGGAIAMKIRF